MIKRKIVLRFIVGADEDNNYRYKTVTLKNIRPELDDHQMSEFVTRYCALTAHVLEEAVVVDERRLRLDEEVERFEEIPEEQKEEVISIKGSVEPEKRVTTASLAKFEAREIQPIQKQEKTLQSLQGQAQGIPLSKKSDQNSPPVQKKTFNKVEPFKLTETKGTLKQKLGETNRSETKDQQRSEVKQQSPPLEATSTVLEVRDTNYLT